MVGFLNKLREGYESNEGDYLEEQYEKLFPKIGRDFLYREDFENIMHEFIERLYQTTPNFYSSFNSYPINLNQENKAIEKALEYKENLKKVSISNRYKDLVNLDE